MFLTKNKRMNIIREERAKVDAFLTKEINRLRNAGYQMNDPEIDSLWEVRLSISIGEHDR